MIVVTKFDNPDMPDGREVKVLCESCGFYLMPMSQPNGRFRAEHVKRGCERDGEVVEGSIYQ